MAQIQIPDDVFYKLVLHFVAGDHDHDTELAEYLKDKYAKVLAHNTYKAHRSDFKPNA